LAAHDRLNVSAGLASLAVAAVLVALKLWGLAETGALSIAASMADSALDLLVSLTGLVAILYAARPADEDHAFGHSSAEDLAALSQSLLVAVSAVLILITALRRLAERGHVDLESEGRGIFVMIVASALTFALVVWQRRVATRTGNRVVAADSLHYLSDLLPNVGAIAALAASRWFGLPHVDSLVAVAAALILAFAALRIGQRAFDALMDRRADPSVIETVRKITGAWPGIRGFHDLKTRTAGSTIFIQIHIELDGSQTLSEAHAIGAGLRREILRVVPHAQVIIHKDPVGDMPAP
jgi:ferrous-iron efflux pump FieF